MGLIAALFRGLVALIDTIVYWLLIRTYNLLIDISQVNIFGESTLADFGSRIYTILGVIMLFKLSFSVITYIIEPDKLADGKNGFQNIVKNIVIMLVMIVAVPFVFKYAMALQYVIVEDNTIGRLVTGRSGSSNKNAGENMAVAILSGFVRPNESISECADIGLNPTKDDKCKNKLNEIESGLGNTYYAAFAGEYKDEYKYLLNAANSTAKVGDDYAITYRVILSTLVGGFTAYIFLMFCIEIAVRTVKLGFLELIAPIPIVTYMDNGGKDGVFKKWLKECTGTYISLFIRLAAIQFGIHIISAYIINVDPQICHWNFDEAGNTLKSTCDSANFFVVLFLILGTLTFIKELPKLIESITGLKLEGSFTLNPVKKMTSIPLAGKALGTAVGGIDSWAHGRGLWNGLKKGWNSVPLGGAPKTLSDLTPFHAETHKNVLAGEQEIKQRREKEKNGEKLYSKYREAVQNYNSDTTGTVEKPDKDEFLVNEFHNKKFAESYMKMSKAKAEMYKRQNDLSQAQAELNAAMSSGDSNRIDQARKAYDTAKKAEGTATSRYEVAKADHESNRKIYTRDAEVQDMFDYIDKTNPEDILSNTPAASANASRPATRTQTARRNESDEAMNAFASAQQSVESERRANLEDEEIMNAFASAQQTVESDKRNNQNNNGPQS